MNKHRDLVDEDGNELTIEDMLLVSHILTNPDISDEIYLATERWISGIREDNANEMP